MNIYFEGVIITVCINLIAVLGVSVMTGFTRLFSFGNAGFMAIGAYTSAILTKNYHVPFFVAMIAGAVMAGVVAYLLGRLTLRLDGDYFLITTLGFGEGVRVLFNYIAPITGGAQGMAGIAKSASLPFSVISAIVVFVFAWNLIHSKYGRSMTGIREQEIAAQAVGIDPMKTKVMAFVVSAIFAGWAGGLYAHSLTFISPVMFNLPKSAELTITAVIGGLGSLTGSVMGTLIITLLPEIFRSLADYRMLVYGVAVVCLIVFKPDGLYGYREFHLIRRFFGKKEPQAAAKKGSESEEVKRDE
ncbi:MAG: branched-chain amino acid ABC transporter permease [Ndongobacter sp.]|nr:branched-chain amino acid ABC transporter permease [Ndongobacter sp.]